MYVCMYVCMYNYARGVSFRISPHLPPNFHLWTQLAATCVAATPRNTAMTGVLNQLGEESHRGASKSLRWVSCSMSARTCQVWTRWTRRMRSNMDPMAKMAARASVVEWWEARHHTKDVLIIHCSLHGLPPAIMVFRVTLSSRSGICRCFRSGPFLSMLSEVCCSLTSPRVGVSLATLSLGLLSKPCSLWLSGVRMASILHCCDSAFPSSHQSCFCPISCPGHTALFGHRKVAWCYARSLWSSAFLAFALGQRPSWLD